jgi:hypothetical protein
MSRICDPHEPEEKSGYGPDVIANESLFAEPGLGFVLPHDDSPPRCVV